MRGNIVDNITVHGYAHLRNNLECQDYSCSWQSRTYDAVIISDGHGGEKYIRSAKGSQFACEAAKKAIDVFMDHLTSNTSFYKKFIKQPEGKLPEESLESDLHEKTPENHLREESLYQLKSAIIQGWNELVKQDIDQFALQDDPRYAALQPNDVKALEKTPEKAYGATLLAVVLTKDFYLVLKLGDGNVCLCNEEKKAMLVNDPTLEDRDLQFNFTTSLCNSNALDSFKHGFFPLQSSDKICGLTVTTDGVINSYTAEERYLELITDIITAYCEQPLKTAHNDLAEWLPQLSEKGSGDDLSIAMIVCDKNRMN